MQRVSGHHRGRCGKLLIAMLVVSGSLEEVTATHIVSPSHFYVQPCHALGKLRQLSLAMQQYCRGANVPTPSFIQPGLSDCCPCCPISYTYLC